VPGLLQHVRILVPLIARSLFIANLDGGVCFDS
jgi:hypothetical protein